MDYKSILRQSPWLRLVDKFGISSRLLKATDGNMFVVFNVLHQTYELHSCTAAQTSGFSCNATIDPEKVNGFLLYDIKENDLKKFLYDIMAEREDMQRLHDKQEANRWSAQESLKQINKILGTNI